MQAIEPASRASTQSVDILSAPDLDQQHQASRTATMVPRRCPARANIRTSPPRVAPESIESTSDGCSFGFGGYQSGLTTCRPRDELGENCAETRLDRPPFFARPNEEDGRFEPRRTRAGGWPCPLHSSQQVRPRTRRGSCTRNSTAWTVCRDRGSCRPDRLCVMEAEQNRRIKKGTAPISRDGRGSRPG